MSNYGPKPLPAEDRFWAKVDRRGANQCWDWTATTTGSFGYGIFRIGSSKDGSRKTIVAHRFSWELHNGPIPLGMFALHRCDNPRCVNPSHLFLGTKADNTADCIAKGRFCRGERSANAKLTESQVREIRRCGPSVAKQFGISARHARKIVAGVRWAHI